jgi:3',5'-nucleoside bisphosphate phosphatase
LVQLAHGAGLRTIGVTDHDTMAGVPMVETAATSYGIKVVPGIEITSVSGGRDVHVLGYFLDADSPELQEMLQWHRAERLNRAREIAVRLAQAGAPIDVDELIASAPPNAGKALARPQIARALIAAGHVATVAEAFDKFLGETCAAYVPHRGASPAEVVELIARAGGVSSLAHPGTTRKDELIPSLRAVGMTAIEVYHSAHSPEDRDRYLAMARELNLAVTGGSDFHGPTARRAEFFGTTNLPEAEFRRIQAMVGRVAASA